MSSSRCFVCQGSGKVMGGGMMYSDCSVCDGDGKVYVKDASAANDAPKKPIEIDRRSKSYKEAVQKIMDSEGCDKDAATKIFDEEFHKL